MNYIYQYLNFFILYIILLLNKHKLAQVHMYHNIEV